MSKKTPKPKPRKAEPEDVGSEAQRFKFDYIKSNNFRVIHVDGAWGGLRPDLTFHVSLYSERPAIPKSITLEFDPEDLTTERNTDIESRDAVIRDVEVCALMNVDTARALRDWLSEKLEFVDERLAEMTSSDDEETT